MASIKNFNRFFTKSEFDIFLTKPTQNSIINSYYVEYRTIATTDSDSLEFEIKGSREYIDMSQTQLYLITEIRDQDTNTLVTNKVDEEGAPENIQVNLINNYHNSLFNNVGVQLNHKSVTLPDNCYHYRSYFENTLNYAYDAKHTHLQSAIFVADDESDMNEFDGEGFKTRKQFINEEGQIESLAYVHTELGCQNQLLLSNVNVRYTFQKNKPSFSLYCATANKKFKIIIRDAKLFVRKVTPKPTLAASHELTLLNDPARYNINRVDCRSITLPKECNEKVLDNLYLGQLPKLVFLAVIPETSQFNFQQNPYNFKHMNLNLVQLSSDSHTHISPIQCNFEKKQFVQAYSSFIKACGIHLKTREIGLINLTT
jgi:hypothetical protein